MRASTPLPTIITLDLCGPVAGIAQGVPGKPVVLTAPTRRVASTFSQGGRR